MDPTTSVAPCYNCGKQDVAPIKFSWWGGVLGPKLLHHVKCNNCFMTYNAKTGQSNGAAIGIYIAVTSVIAIVLVAGIFFAL